MMTFRDMALILTQQLYAPAATSRRDVYIAADTARAVKCTAASQQPVPIASLPWYDLPATAAHLDSLWRQLRHPLEELSGLRLPDSLQRDIDVTVQWQSPGLVLSQCCGPDLLGRARELVVIGQPVLAGLDCSPGEYFSHVIARPGYELPRESRIAVNSTSSWSGHHALLKWMQAAGLSPAETVTSGAHARSIELVSSGAADLAAIDAFSWKFLEHGGLTVIDDTHTAPAPPLVCHPRSPLPPDVVGEVLRRVLAEYPHPMFKAMLPASRQLYEEFLGKESHIINNR